MAFCNRVEHTTVFPAARPGRRAPTRGAPTGTDRCDNAGHTSGPIRFRQQLFFSTSGSAPSLRRQGQRIQGCVFLGHEATGFPKADGQIRFRQQQPLFWVDFFSGQNGVLQQGRTCNRVPGRASKAQGHLQGAPLRDRSLRQCRTYKRTDLFPSTTILFYLWSALILEDQVQCLRGCVFPSY